MEVGDSGLTELRRGFPAHFKLFNSALINASYVRSTELNSGRDSV